MYLLHDNPIINSYMWNEMFKVSFHANTKTFLLFVLVVVIVLFAVALVLDLIRRLIILGVKNSTEYTKNLIKRRRKKFKKL